jgi:hypothetical protein
MMLLWMKVAGRRPAADRSFDIQHGRAKAMRMKTSSPLIRLAALIGLCLCTGGAMALPMDESATAADSQTRAAIVPVMTDCYTVGQKIAEKNGGQLARAAPQMRNGRTVCVIVVLVPARDGQRPRRAEFIVPAR